ncbi:hypothetical protein SAMCCGM7_pC1060 (plasmid) [Sinorhizobium americanum CCGM7]|nr:hypothetical protein SAMCCGM7_pC1060 [Sinorhizobium americanum CCGM7]
MCASSAEAKVTIPKNTGNPTAHIDAIFMMDLPLARQPRPGAGAGSRNA